MGGKSLDYINVLKALNEIPFGVGKKLLIDFLQGKTDNVSIQKNNLQSCTSFGSMAYEEDELELIIAELASKGFIRYASVNGKHWWRVMELTSSGIAEIQTPTLNKQKEALQATYSETKITDADRQQFKALGKVLDKYNDEQKKAIISANNRVLCIAGAGSGKTTVLTKRAEFLAKYRGVASSKILAITFTRKARREMQSRIKADGIRVETFNSFCEKILRKHNDLVYDRLMKVVSYSDKLRMLSRALSAQRISIDRAIDVYFTHNQKRNKTHEQLVSILLNDCFFIRDYLNSKGVKIEQSQFKDAPNAHKDSAEMIYKITAFFDKYMREKGLRDFSDQITDTLSLFANHPETIPKFEHVLVDEYQDVNAAQIKILDALDAPNLFVVGDPRQSIYGWRGSDIRHIIDFQKENTSCDIITLKKNYRSTKHIVNLANQAIKHMGVSDMEPVQDGEKDIRLLQFPSEASEYEFIIQRLLMEDAKPSEVFVLARTNRQLNDLSDILKQRNIRHVVRSDEVRKPVLASDDEITLATVHSIKGMEADVVYLIGASGVNFPCKGSEHPIIDMVTVDEYDKEEEEKRLFYVALSRARRSLFVTYSSKRPTRFITKAMMESLGELKVQNTDVEYKVSAGSKGVVERLKSWRRQTALDLGVPSYIILTDKSILDIAQKMPATIDDLEDVHGIGPSKIRRYGKDILKLIM